MQILIHSEKRTWSQLEKKQQLFFAHLLPPICTVS